MEAAHIARRLAGGRPNISLIGLTDPDRLPDPRMALTALPCNSALIWRAYGTAPDALNLRRLSAEASAKGCMLIIAGHPRSARRLGTQGLHLPERSLSRRYENGYLLSLRDLPPGLTLTAACHSETAIRAAARAGAAAVLISPVFTTASHPGAKTLGVIRFARLAHLARSLGMAPYALGGIEIATNIKRLFGSGAAGVAGISLLQS